MKFPIETFIFPSKLSFFPRKTSIFPLKLLFSHEHLPSEHGFCAKLSLQIFPRITKTAPFGGTRGSFFSQQGTMVQPIETFQSLMIPVGNFSHRIELADDFQYRGASPQALTQQILGDLQKGVIPNKATSALKGIMLSNLVGPKKAAGLGDKTQKYGEGMRKATAAYSKVSGEVKTLSGYSSNALPKAFPEFSILMLSSASGKPTPALLQLDLRPALMEAVRSH